MTLLLLIVLAACGGNNDVFENGNDTEGNTNETEGSNNMNGNEDAHMDHSSSGEVPDDLKEAEDPKYPIDSEAEIKADHMEGMDGAVGTIEGAYDTTAYIVTYETTDRGEKVENHKWVIHEEIENEADEPYDENDEVVLEANHMEGMEGAEATVDSAEDTTVYMVSYEDTNSEEEIDNHKWVTEDELSEIK